MLVQVYVWPQFGKKSQKINFFEVVGRYNRLWNCILHLEVDKLLSKDAPEKRNIFSSLKRHLRIFFILFPLRFFHI
jgi:hypothetical protein